MKKKNGSPGFTTYELLIVWVFVAFPIIGVGIIGVGIKGNFYWTESGVVSQLQEEYPGVEKMIVSQSQRNVWRDSRITVMQKGAPVTYCLDTDIFFDYQLTPCGD